MDHRKNKRQRYKPPVQQPTKFQGDKEELLDGNYFDCTGYGQSDRFVKTVGRITDLLAQDYKQEWWYHTHRSHDSSKCPYLYASGRLTATILYGGENGSTVISRTPANSPPSVQPYYVNRLAESIIPQSIQNHTATRLRLGQQANSHSLTNDVFNTYYCQSLLVGQQQAPPTPTLASRTLQQQNHDEHIAGRHHLGFSSSTPASHCRNTELQNHR